MICLDNFFTGAMENIEHLRGKENFELIRHDVVEPILLEVDQIYHLACPASPVHYKFNPVKTIKVRARAARAGPAATRAPCLTHAARANPTPSCRRT